MKMEEAQAGAWLDFQRSPIPRAVEFDAGYDRPVRALNTAALLCLLEHIGLDWRAIR